MLFVNTTIDSNKTNPIAIQRIRNQDGKKKNALEMTSRQAGSGT